LDLVFVAIQMVPPGEVAWVLVNLLWISAINAGDQVMEEIPGSTENN